MDEDLTYLTLIYGDLNDYNIIDKIPIEAVVSAYKKYRPHSANATNIHIFCLVSRSWRFSKALESYDFISSYTPYLWRELLVYHNR